MVSFCCSGRDISLSALGTSLEIVGFTSFLGFGGNGLFGVVGAVICFVQEVYFLKIFGCWKELIL